MAGSGYGRPGLLPPMPTAWRHGENELLPGLSPIKQVKMAEHYLTKQEVADRLRVSVSAVDKWMGRGRIPFIRFSARLVRFDWDEVRRAFTSHAHPAIAGALSRNRRRHP